MSARLLQHAEVEKVVQVEIDEMVVQASRAYFPDLASSFDNPRVSLRIGDGIAYVTNRSCLVDGPFDVAIVDMTDSPLQSLLSADFYHGLASCVVPDGVVAQNVQSWNCIDAVNRTASLHRTAFRYAHPYTAATPDYLSPYFFLLSSQVLACPHTSSNRPLDARYYSQAVHAASFALPAAARSLAEGGGSCTRNGHLVRQTTLHDPVQSQSKEGCIHEEGYVGNSTSKWKSLLKERSQFQRLEVWEERHMSGRNTTYLMLDGDLQLTSADEYIYHEMLVHVAVAMQWA